MSEPVDGHRVGRMRVVVVSPVRIYRQGLGRLLEGEDGVELTGTVDEAAAVAPLLDRPGVDVVLLDMTGDLAGRAGLAVLRAIAETTDVPVVALGIPDRASDVVACAEAGMAGYVSNESTFDDLVDTLRAATRGEFACKARVTAGIVLRLAALARERRRTPVTHLTSRELEIVTLIDSGFSNKEIASHLSIQLATVKNHVHNILDKLGVQRRGEAAAAVRRYQTAT
jgi:two-component system, NarL family, nitrate/nitrite response regulator NarL